VDFAGEVRNVAQVPVIVTGTFRSVAGRVEAIEVGQVA